MKSAKTETNCSNLANEIVWMARKCGILCNISNMNQSGKAKKTKGGRMKHQLKIAMAAVLIVALLVGTPLLGCGGGGGEKVITIGVITDLTGPAGPALQPMLLSLQDLVRHINEDDPIPGVKLKVAVWDDRLDSSRDIPGYEWLKERGAKVIICAVDFPAAILKPFAERDKVVILDNSCSLPLIEPPGWVFCANCPMYQVVLTTAKWIGDQWDYTEGIPKIGCIGLNASASIEAEKKLKDYCQAHPDKFDYVDGFLVPFATTTWGGQVEKLKDCDWICFPGTDGASIATFVEQFRGKGYTARFFGQEALLTFGGLVLETIGGYGPIDGSVFGAAVGWWSDTFPVSNLLKELLHKYHPGEEETVRESLTYIAGGIQNHFCLELIRAAITEVGAENFDGQALYNTAVRFKMTFEGYAEWGFTDTKRACLEHIRVFKASAEAQDFVAVSDWLPVVE